MTTQWQSMFDGGACEVSVSNALGSLLAQVVAKGNTPIPISDTGASLAVTADGLVTITGAGQDMSGWTLTVTPQYDVSQRSVQMTDIAVQSSTSAGTGAVAENGGEASQINVTIDPSTGTGTPSTVTFAALANACASLVKNQGF